MLFKRLKYRFSIVVLLAASSASFSNQVIDQFNSLEASNGYFWGEDMIYYFTNFTIIQDYESNDEDERLSLKSLSQGDWLVITYNANETGVLTASKILIVPNESTARKVRRLSSAH